MDPIIDALSRAISEAKTEMKGRLGRYVPEVESRIGVMRDSHHCAHYNWERLFEEMGRMDVPRADTNITNITFGLYHLRIRHAENITSGRKELYAEAKIKGYPIVVEGIEPDANLWIRYSVSAETERHVLDAREGDTVEDLIERVASEIKYARRTERIINRYSFDVADNYRLDMSRVYSEGAYTYEIELEMLNPGSATRESIRDFVRYSREISRLSRGSSFMYSVPELKVLVTLVNLFGDNTAPDMYHVDRGMFNDVRTISDNDLRYRGIVGGKSKFMARLKTDGKRTFSIISPFGWWFIYPPYVYDLAVPDSYKFVTQGEITILDGELIPPESRLDGSENVYYYEVFDCLVCGGSDIRSMDLVDRCEYAKHYMKELALREDYPEVEYIRVEFGRYVAIDGSNFFQRVTDLFANSLTLPYKTDGLIFAPNNYKYWCSMDYSKANESRNVEIVPEILKWKSPVHTTIDFKINRTENDEIDLLTVERIEGEEKLSMRKFEGTDRYPFDSKTMVDKESLTGVFTGTIVEMKFSDGQFRMLKTRPEKEKPNSVYVATSNWTNINSPIVQDTLTGGDLELMYRYHNRKIASLYEGHTGALLDGGSGRGGGMGKWSQFGIIVCVEINDDNMDELIRRAKYYGRQVISPGDNKPIKNNFIVAVRGSITETERIKAVVDKYVGKGVDFVSLMNVGTFLWKDEKTLTAAMKTVEACLSPGGSFAWIMLDGIAVRSVIEKKDADKGPGERTLKYSTFSLRYEYIDEVVSNKVVVSFGKGKIVGENQEEYLTNIDNMYSVLDRMTKGGEKIVKKLDAIANDERFLGTEALALSKLYRYGKMEREGKRETPLFTTPTRPTRGRSAFRGRLK